MYAKVPVMVTALGAAALALAGCQGAPSHQAVPTVTVTVTEMPGSVPPQSTDVPTANHQWSGGKDGTAMYAVGPHAQPGLAAAIPPGRYNVRLANGADDGSWMICDAPVCGPAFQENATVIGKPVGPHTSTMYIGPGAVTVWLDHVVLSAVND